MCCRTDKDTNWEMLEQWSVLAGAGSGPSDASDSSMPLKYILGPILVGVLLNCFVYGVVFLHYVQYMLGHNRDSWGVK